MAVPRPKSRKKALEANASDSRKAHVAKAKKAGIKPSKNVVDKSGGKKSLALGQFTGVASRGKARAEDVPMLGTMKDRISLPPYALGYAEAMHQRKQRQAARGGRLKSIQDSGAKTANKFEFKKKK